MAHRCRILTLLLLALGTLVGCSSLPRQITVQPGERVRIALQQADGKVFTLQNESSGSAESVYRDAHADLGLKVAKDDKIQLLLDLLAAKGMFERATSHPAPDARDVLSVVTQHAQYHWSRRKPQFSGTRANPTIDEGELPFHEARAYFFDVYVNTIAYHGRQLDKRALQAEQARARQSNDSARSRAEGLNAPKGNSK
ncbi:MAG: hypothetical protein IPK26_21715 [Planctomycetes bacterium]|nr:hypothetical protein [Planctomycetota bacterium]